MNNRMEKREKNREGTEKEQSRNRRRMVEEEW